MRTNEETAAATLKEIAEMTAPDRVKTLVDGDRLVSKAETLELIGGCTYPMLWAMVRDGKFPPGRYVGRRLHWLMSEITQYIDTLPLQVVGDREPGIRFPGIDAVNARRARAEPWGVAAAKK